LLLLPKYHVAFLAELRVKDKVLHLVHSLRRNNNNGEPSAGGGGSSGGAGGGATSAAAQAAAAVKLTKEQKTAMAKELAQQRADMVNQLTALVTVYTDSVLAYTRAFQELAVSIEAVRLFVFFISSLFYLVCVCWLVLTFFPPFSSVNVGSGQYQNTGT
jgi:hypothetical protein